MLVSAFMTGVNDALRGTDDNAPTANSTDWDYWLRILNRKKNELYSDVTKSWHNTFEVREIGTVSASEEPSFDLDDDFLGASDYFYIITTAGDRVEYNLVKPQERSRLHREGYIAGMNPEALFITNEISATEDIVGGAVHLPGYWLPADLTRATDTLPFTMPDWAVLAVAAEVAANDITYEDKEENLNAKANNLYGLMVSKNHRGTYKNPRVAPTYVGRIGARLK
jgi:hypothetical protein